MILRIAALASLASGAAAQTVWPDLEVARTLFAEHDLLADYDALRARLGQAGTAYRASGTPRITTAMLGDPLGAPALAIALTDRLESAARADPIDLHALCGEAARTLDLDVPPPDLGPDRDVVLLRSAPEWDARLDLAASLLADAHDEIEVALRAIPAADRPALRDATLALLDRFIVDIYPTNDPVHAATVATLRKVDHAALLRATCILAPLARADFWTPLRAEAARRKGVTAPPGVSGKVLDVRDTAVGPIVIGGFGSNSYDLDAALIVDFAGDDRYAARATRADLGQPVNVVVDLRGDDRYGSDGDGALAQGAALLGVSILADHLGDDRYRAGRIAQGAGVAGVGVLVDHGGRDEYGADAYAQGCGFLGCGLLLDARGDDRMTAQLYAQGFGGPLAFGAVIDLQGADLRRATGGYPSSYGTAGEFMAMSQGAGVGMRTLSADKLHVAGGVGVLLDGGGDDVDEVGEFGHGIGYFLGAGIVRDRGGDDRVTASRYGIATGAHQAVAIVLDDAGDDHYLNPHTASIAGNWDHVVSVLVDAAGDDEYVGAGITCGASTITSFAALVDGAGDDRYEAGGSDLALGRCGHPFDVRNGSRSVALLLDLGGGTDRYANAPADPAPADGKVLVRRREDDHDGARAPSGSGLFIDR